MQVKGKMVNSIPQIHENIIGNRGKETHSIAVELSCTC